MSWAFDDPGDDLVPIMFVERRGYVSGTWNGMPVYRHREYEDVIKPGTTWLCTLTLNPKTGENYFAAPVREVTREDVAEHIAGHTDEVLGIMLESHREDLVSILAEVLGRHDEADVEPKREPVPVPARPRAPSRRTELPVEEGYPVGGSDLVEIVDGDTLRSELFTEPRYFVSISPDLRQLRLRADRNGRVVCRDGCVQLAGLERATAGRRSSDISVSVGSEGRTIILRFQRSDRQLDGEFGAAGAGVAFEVRGVGGLREFEGRWVQRTPACWAGHDGERVLEHDSL